MDSENFSENVCLGSGHKVSVMGGRRVFSRGMKQKYDFKEGFQTKCTKMEGV